MTALNKQALLRAAVKVGAHTWEAEGSRVWSMSNGTADCLVLEVFGDETSGQQDCDIASFIAEASPANVLALLDELKESQALGANESACADSTINLAINWQMRCKDAEAKLEAAEKRIAELEARAFKVEMPESFYPDGDIDAPLVVDELEVIAAIVEAGGKPVAFCKRCDHEIDLTHRPDGSHYCHAPAAGIGVKGERDG